MWLICHLLLLLYFEKLKQTIVRIILGLNGKSSFVLKVFVWTAHNNINNNRTFSLRQVFHWVYLDSVKTGLRPSGQTLQWVLRAVRVGGCTRWTRAIRGPGWVGGGLQKCRCHLQSPALVRNVRPLRAHTSWPACADFIFNPSGWARSWEWAVERAAPPGPSLLLLLLALWPAASMGLSTWRLQINTCRQQVSFLSELMAKTGLNLLWAWLI